MHPFPIEEDPVPLPPVSSYQRVIAAFDGLARADRYPSWLVLRSHEDALMDAKAVDERVRSGEWLPLAGVLVALPDNPLLLQRLVKAGAVVLATVDRALQAGAVRLDVVDAVVITTPPDCCRDLVGLRPTRGLVPTMEAVTVLAADIDIAQRTAAAVTGPDHEDRHSRAWPTWARLSAGEHPRIVVPDERDLPEVSSRAGAGLGAVVDTLCAASARVERVPLADVVATWAQTSTTDVCEYDALLLPLTGTRVAFADLLAHLDAAAVVVPDGAGPGIGVLTKAFHDQVAIDIATLLTGAQAKTPYPTVGLDLVVFGAYLRGQPRHAELARLAPRFAGFAWTAPHYRMVALPGMPPQAGVVDSDEGAALLAERWLISPAGMSAFLADLPTPMTLGRVELEDGTSSTGMLCDPVAASRGTDVTDFGCWRAYLRHLSTRRSVARPVSG